MKVCSCPIPEPQVDYRNYDRDKAQADEAAHQEALKAHLIGMGYKGPHTGAIYRSQIADGYALYMFADGGKQSCLIHLPYGDAYNDPDVRHVPKTEILKRIAADKRLAALFADAAAAKKTA